MLPTDRLTVLPRSMCHDIREQIIPLSIPDRDARLCSCLHPCGHHVSTTADGEYAGAVGGGTCSSCPCDRFTPMVNWDRRRRQVWLELCTLAGRAQDVRRDGDLHDWRTTMTELRAALALTLGANPDYLCPATGQDMARAEMIDPAWCCASGHRGLLPVHHVNVMLVMVDRHDEGGLDRTLLLEERISGLTVLPRTDWRGWHRWTLSRVRQRMRDHGWYTPYRRIEAFTVDLDHARVTGWKGHEPLGPVVDVRWGQSPAGEPVVDVWWDK